MLLQRQRKRKAAGEDQQVSSRSLLNCLSADNSVDTAFKQQRLKAWQPILTPKTVLPTLFIIGIIFAPIGGLLVWGSSLVSFPCGHTPISQSDILAGIRNDIRLHSMRETICTIPQL